MIKKIDLVSKIRKNEMINFVDPTVDIYETWYRFMGRGKLKSIFASRIIELRMQYIPFCQCIIEDPSYNDVIGRSGVSNQDLEYQWHFAHRHNFPSNLHSSGRGERKKFYDIFHHPVSYVLMCSAHHEEYDREDDEWRNPKNNKN